MTDELRELDRMVAAGVMGWTPADMGGVGGEWWEDDGPDGGCIPLPQFSADIDAAWQVVERMRELKWVLEYHDDAAGCTAIFRNFRGTKGHVTARTAPEAICRAALAALEAMGNA